MEKQTLIFTALPVRIDGPLAPGSTLRLSVFISPRLRSDDPSVTALSLGQFPDFLDWPARIESMQFQVEFDGAPPVSVMPAVPILQSSWWKALFDSSTLVLPYDFAEDDCSGAELEVLPVAEIHDKIREIYRRVGSDPGYGAGKRKPTVDVLARDPGFQEIARPTEPAPPYEGPPQQERPVPITPKPGTGGGGTTPDNRPRGCLSWILFVLILRSLFRFRPRQPHDWVELGLFGFLFAKFCRFCRGSRPPAAASNAAASPRSLHTTSAPLTKAASGTTASPIKPGAPAKSAAFNQLSDFVKPFDEKFAPMPNAAQLKDQYDFHKMVSLLGDYPALLRALGLVVDLEVPWNAAISTTANATVRVTATWTPALPATTNYSPRTHYILEADRFLARPRPVDPELSNGLLKLNDSNAYRVIQADAIGGGLKLANTATNLTWQRSPKNPGHPPNMPDDSGVPALRTGGISLVRPGYREDLLRQFSFQALFNGALTKTEDPAPAAPAEATAELFAEDVTRGYRVDVHDDRSNKWHSLCQRVGTYRFLNGPIVPPDVHDEGFVQFGATEQLTPTPKRRLRTTESLCTWDGWSLCAPRPGNSLQVDDSSGPTPNTATTNFRLETRFAAELGSLPRLRYGWNYRLRARAVDLAGNSAFAPGDAAFAAGPAEATPPFVFTRFEPVAPPALFLRDAPKEGESLERMVVRSVPLAPAAIAATERHVVPPKIAQIMAEQHEQFDAKPKMKRDQTGYDLAAREAGSLTHQLTSAGLQPMAGIVKVDKPEHTLWLQTNEQFELAYLPDLLARGAFFRGLPGVASTEDAIDLVNRIAFDGTWPELQPFRIRLVGITSGSPAAPFWEPAPQRRLTVELPPGAKQTVLLNSFLQPDDLAHKGVWGWIRDSAPANLATLTADAAASRHWMETPYRALVLVHAVQQPLAIPSLVTLTTKKLLHETSATLEGSITIHRASTGKIDLFAQWDDPLDDPAKPTFDPTIDVTPHRMHVCELSALEEGSAALDLHETNPGPIVQNLGDTKYHRVAYWPEATTRFREYFPPKQPDITRPAPGESPLDLEAEVLNSGRPDAPKIHSVIPSFRWEEKETADPGGIRKITHVRSGNGLRVYLERPWFSSGWDERLGVVFVEGASFQKLADNVRPFVTQWGRDPLWSSEALPTAASLSNFHGFADKGDGYSLDEMAGVSVAAAGYAVEYDATRGLWFADVEMQIGQSYAPFVRLALARFQPHSVAGAHLSRVTRADYAQLPPDRHTRVTILPSPTTTKLEVVIKGPSFAASSATAFGFAPGKVKLTLERKNPQLSGDLAWEAMNTADYQTNVTSAASPLVPFTAEISVANPAAPQDMRLVVREYEHLRADTLPDVVAVSGGAEVTERLVYADVFEL